jgi:DNA primase
VGIVEEDIAKVRAATDFVALAGEHLALRRVGTRWVGLCPFHTEKSPSFSINAELGMYYCFGCGAKGDVITFLREVEHLDFVEAVENLAGRAGISLRYDNESTGRDHQRRSRIHETLESAIAWYHQKLLSGPDSAAARAYLRSRGYDGEVVRHYRLGWAPDGWDRLLKTLGIPPPALVDAGLATVDQTGRYTDFFRARLLFPIFEAGGRPVGAGGRLLPGGRGPKYKNTAGTAVYDKSRVLYGLNWAKKAVVDRSRVVVCEGYTDVIGLQQAGVEEAVATCGTALADGHIRLLTNFARRIVLAYDADAAGQAAAERFYEWENRYEVDIRVAALPGGADPADLARTDPAALAASVEGARPYLAFRLDRLFARVDLSNPEGRARAAGEAMALVSEHPNDLVRDQYLMQVADRCRVEPDRLRQLGDATRGRRGAVAGSAAGGNGPGSGGAANGRSQGGAPNGRSQAGAGDDPGLGGMDRPEPVAVSGPELEALRLAVHRPEEVAARLERNLFAHPLSAAAFDALSAAGTFHAAVEAADPQAAELLQRLAVEESDADPDDIMIRLVERATQRALRDLQAEMRQADPAGQADYAPIIAWLKLALETMRSDDVSRKDAAVDAEERLVGWLVARDREMSRTEAKG